MTGHSRYWADYTTKELRGLDAQSTVALLPVSATEQHGPHLPVSVDADIATALVAQLTEELAEEVPLLVLPPMPFGVSIEHADFPGTISLSAETMLRVLREIGRGVADAGIRKLILLNSHGGNPQVLDLTAHKLRRKHRMLVFPLNAYRYWDGAAMFGASEASHGIHAGAVETAIMRAIKPAAVREGEVKNFPSLSESMAEGYEHLRPFGRTASFGWQSQDLNPEGAVGDAARGLPEEGKMLLRQAVATLAQLVEEISRLPLSTMRDGLDG